MAYSKTLQCCWTSWRAVSDTTLELHSPEQNAPDMAGCIKIAKFLLPGVTLIRTYSDRSRDTMYMKSADGQWSAARPLSARLRSGQDA
jgi:hypothetical protein